MEMGKILLDSGERIMVAMKWQNNLADFCSCSSDLWNLEFLSSAIGYLAEEIAKQSVEGMAWFLLLMVKCKREEGIVKQKGTTILKFGEFPAYSYCTT